MRTSLDCIPCFARQALQAARHGTDSPAVHERVLRDILRATAEMDLMLTPPVVAQKIHRQLRELTGVHDPYLRAKEGFNQMSLDMLPDLLTDTRAASDPFYHAVRLSIAGNVIDLGHNGNLTEEEARQDVLDALHAPFSGDVPAFQQSCQKAERILYLADNAGEIVFDQLLIDQLPVDRLTVAVRGGPVLNDATYDDALATGLCDLVEVIDNGSDAPGTILSDCSEEFQTRFRSADLIISKGQGNFETLSEVDANIYFLFKAKCPVVADHVGLPTGVHVLTQRRAYAPDAETQRNFETV